MYEAIISSVENKSHSNSMDFGEKISTIQYLTLSAVVAGWYKAH